MPTQREIREYLPDGFTLDPRHDHLRIIAPDRRLAKLFHEGTEPYLKESAKKVGAIQIFWDGCKKPIRIKGQSDPTQPDRPTPAQPTEQPQQINSYAPSRISPSASYEEIMDFVRGWRAQGLIVTVTSMVSDRCVHCNDLQVMDRNPPIGTKWTIENWVSLDFKQLWRDSFLPGRHNYYGDLVSRVASDQYIPEFVYQIRRISGAMSECSTDYHYVENFAGVPVRIGISKQGDWRLVEDAHLERQS